jgi:hypothetical protein
METTADNISAEPGPEPAEDALAAFRHRSCLKCEYDLRGLPERGVCPECGGSYDRDTLVVAGWTSPAYAPGLSHTLRNIVLFLLIILFVAPVLTTIFTAGGLTVQVSAFAVIGIIGLAAYTAYRRRIHSRQHGGDIRLVVSMEACELVDRPLDRRLHRFDKRLYVRLSRRRRRLKRLHISRYDPRPWRLAGLGIGLGPTAIVMYIDRSRESLEALCDELARRGALLLP